MKFNISVKSRDVEIIRSSTWSRAGFIVLSFVTIPALLLVQAWKTKSFRYRHYLLTGFVTAYGSTIAIQYDPTGQGSDGVRHLLLVYEHYVGLSFENFLIDLWNTIALKETTNFGIRDPYKHIVSYLVGGVLGMPWLFFTVVAFVYGYFFTGSLLEIFKHTQWSRLNYVLLGFAALMFIIKNIEGVNTVRTWTGMWVLVYACLRYYDTRQLRYILLMLMPPLIHVGYFVMVLPALAVLVFGNRPLLYTGLFVVSSFTTIVNPGTAVEALSVTDRGAQQVRSYYREEVGAAQDVIQQASGETRWYRTYYQAGIQKWALNIFIYTLLLGGIYFSCMNYRQKTLFSIGLMTLSLSNSTWFISALSGRSWLVGCTFIFAAFIMANTDPESRARITKSIKPYYRVGLNFSLFLFFPYFLFNLSTLLDFPSVFAFAAPFAVWFDPGINMSIKEFLRMLIGVVR